MHAADRARKCDSPVGRARSKHRHAASIHLEQDIEGGEANVSPLPSPRRFFAPSMAANSVAIALSPALATFRFCAIEAPWPRRRGGSTRIPEMPQVPHGGRIL